MIQRVSHGTIYVLDQDSAKAFYTEKLGFALREDVTMGNFRWLTVGPQEQPDFHFILMKIGAGPNMDETATAQVRELVSSGKLGPGVLATTDCRKTHEELVARGVEFLSPPSERPYGIEAMFKDDSGNVFSLTQRR